MVCRIVILIYKQLKEMDEIHDMQNQEMPNEQEIEEIRQVLTRRFIPKPDIDEAWDNCLRRIGKPTRRTVKMRWMTAAAVTAAAAVVALFVFVKGNKVEQDTAAADVLFAAVTSADNVTVSTAEGDKKVDDQKPLKFSDKQTKVEDITVTTPRGKDMTLELPDGTKAWLNADTKLTFPSQFTGNSREVKLVGEAYFEVTHDKAHPFIVSTERLVTKVLGTSFDVRAYTGSQPSVVLIEGSVQVSTPGVVKATRMKPGELATLSTSGAIDIAEVDTYPYTQWRDGFFYFNNVDAREILKEIGRWYNVSIVVESPEKLSRRLHFVAERDSNLRTTMQHLNGLGNIEVELKEKTIVVR